MVANQVRNLAEQTAQATEQIRSRLEALQHQSELSLRQTQAWIELVGDTTTLSGHSMQHLQSLGTLAQTMGNALIQLETMTADPMAKALGLGDALQQVRLSIQSGSELTRSVDQSAHSLREQADQTEETMAYFRVDAPDLRN